MSAAEGARAFALILLFLQVICGQDQGSKSDGDLHWVKFNPATQILPANAVIGGFEHETLYIARAEHEGSLTPGKYFPSIKRVVISWGSTTYFKENFEILVGSNYKWVLANTDNIPDGAFVGGRTEFLSDPLYIGKANFSGHVIPGKVQKALGACLIAYRNQEVRIKVFEILVASDKTSSFTDVNPHWVKYNEETRKLPADAIPGGYENEGLYIARAKHAGSLTPGKFLPSTGKAVISWGYTSHVKDDFEILCGTNYKWVPLLADNIPDEAVVGGRIENSNAPTYIGRANYSGHVIPGKIPKEHINALIAHKDKEVRVGDFEILVVPENKGESDPHWVKYDSNTNILPPDAIVGGYEGETLYIARAAHEGSITPGKFVPSMHKAVIPWGFVSNVKDEFEILCGRNYKWVKPVNDNIPDGAFVGGRSEKSNNPLFIGKAKYGKDVIPGKAAKDHPTCLIAFDGKEIWAKDYEILIVPPKSNGLDLFSSRPNIKPTPVDCKPTLTKLRNGIACAGQTLFEENFNTFSDDVWQIEQYIPVFSTEFPFVSYQHLSEDPTVSVISGNLRIAPKLQQQLPGFSDASIYTGTLNLFKGCTASADACSKQAWGASILPPIVSGRITSKAFAFTYGTVYVRAKLPQGDWLYPEILLEPLLKKYGSTHHSSGIIKIASARGNKELNSGIADYSNKVLYGGPIMDFQCHDLLLTDRVSTDGHHWGDDFHEYAMRWTPDSIILSVDGVEWARVEPATSGMAGRFPRICSQLPRQVLATGTKMAPFDDFFYLTLGVAAGSITEFPDNIQTSGGRPKPWTNPSSKGMLHFWQDIDAWLATWNQPQLLVDYVKVVAL